MADTEIYIGPRDASFRNLISSVLMMSNIYPEYLSFLLSDRAMQVYDTVFTSKTVNPNQCYELYELLGDRTVNKFIVWYVYSKYPILRCPDATEIIAKILIKYGAKNTLFSIAESLGFWPFISASTEFRNTKMKPLLEDVFESFIGATERMLDDHYQIGVGYAVVYAILSSAYNRVNISFKYEDITSAVTRLTELLTFMNKGKRPYDRVALEYKNKDVILQSGHKARRVDIFLVGSSDPDYKRIVMSMIPTIEEVLSMPTETEQYKLRLQDMLEQLTVKTGSSKWTQIGTGTSGIQSDAKEKAAEEALRWLKDKMHIEPVIKEIYKTLCL